MTEDFSTRFRDDEEERSNGWRRRRIRGGREGEIRAEPLIPPVQFWWEGARMEA